MERQKNKYEAWYKRERAFYQAVLMETVAEYLISLELYVGQRNEVMPKASLDHVLLSAFICAIFTEVLPYTDRIFTLV